MAVLEPVKVTIENFPGSSTIELIAPNFPSDESKGSHKIYFDKVVYIDASDFQEVSLSLYQKLHSLNKLN